MWKLIFLLSVSVTIINAPYIIAQPKIDAIRKLSVISSFHLQKVTDSNSISFRIPAPDKPLMLFVFLSPECPLSKNYTLTLNNLFQQYNQQVRFYGCISGSGFSLEEIKAFRSTYKVLFPFVIDENKKFTNYIAATVTPEVMLLNKEGEMVYSGAIDDWVQDVGIHKANVAKHYLQDAIAASLTNKEVPVKKTTAYGCLINDY